MTNPSVYEQWEPVIGLEIHLELNTRSKLFSSAANRFGDEPNSNISVVCTGQPGVLPILNKEAVKKAVLLGHALKSKVSPYSRFDRKSYFYPDSPRNFQITQFEHPIILGGSVVAEVNGEAKTFEIDRAHLEDDAGMLKHFSSFAGVDYNRAGVPLIEIVSKPCLRSAEDAIAYGQMIRAIAQYLDISDCNMEEGSLRMDANISVRPKGENGFRPKIEIKNMNSFNFLGMAIESEFKRQVKAYLSCPSLCHNEVVPSSTFRFDPDKKQTVLMRRKESADDYRYFIEPDLPPLILEEEYIDSVKISLPELPYERELRYKEKLNLPAESAYILVSEKKLADFFEEALKQNCQAKPLANWIVVEFAGRLKEKGEEIWSCGLFPEHVGTLVAMIESGEITGKIAKSVADEMLLQRGKSPKEIVAERPDFQPLTDTSALEALVDQVLKEQQQSVEDYHNGKEKAFGFLVGQVMKATKGQASPPIVNKLLKEKLKRD
jgi:aspartyl-tRNA(Asn)/glutamyl-tRNA(Gln) amidotransferase subunit B